MLTIDMILHHKSLLSISLYIYTIGYSVCSFSSYSSII